MSETTTEMEYVLLNNLEQKEKEIEELNSEINRKNAVGYRWFKRCMEARTENIRLKRALYKACANWAHFAVAFFAKYSTKEKWRKMENKCLAKAKEYK